MMGYVLRHPEEKRVVDVKSFVQERCQSGDDRNSNDYGAVRVQVPHPENALTSILSQAHSCALTAFPRRTGGSARVSPDGEEEGRERPGARFFSSVELMRGVATR